MTRKPIRRFLPLTYKPKIQGVMDGTITQSIRLTDLQVGDFIAFHGWSGKPYHSPWSFRTPMMQIRHAEPITIRKDSIYFADGKIGSKPCRVAVKACDLDYLAALDGIEPATGEELIRILHEMYGSGTLHGKILRWDPTLIKYHNLNESLKAQESDPFKVPARLIHPPDDFVQLGAFDKSRTNCEGIKEGFVLIRNKKPVSQDTPAILQ